MLLRRYYRAFPIWSMNNFVNMAFMCLINRIVNDNQSPCDGSGARGYGARL